MVKLGVVLLSGGLDSTTTAVYALNLGYKLHAITIHYGQTLKKEIDCAQQICKNLGIIHKIVDVSSFREVAWYSALTQSELFHVPKERNIEEMSKKIPITYVPMRNTFFIVLAAAYLESEILNKIEKENIDQTEIEATIFIAANVLDYSGYPDCRPKYYEKINDLMRSASKVGTLYNIEMKIKTPLLYKNKKEIVELGMKLNVPLEQTWSCYEGQEIPCGECDSCILRAKGFKQAGIEDPLILRLTKEGKI